MEFPIFIAALVFFKYFFAVKQFWSYPLTKSKFINTKRATKKLSPARVLVLFHSLATCNTFWILFKSFLSLGDFLTTCTMFLFSVSAYCHLLRSMRVNKADPHPLANTDSRHSRFPSLRSVEVGFTFCRLVVLIRSFGFEKSSDIRKTEILENKVNCDQLNRDLEPEWHFRGHVLRRRCVRICLRDSGTFAVTVPDKR